MKFAIIRTGGKQYPVREKQVLTIEKLPEAVGGSVIFPDVLLYADGNTVSFGKPTLPKVKVEGKVMVQKKSKKILVVKFKNKVRYLRTRGHRQFQTQVMIQKITA